MGWRSATRQATNAIGMIITPSATASGRSPMTSATAPATHRADREDRDEREHQPDHAAPDLVGQAEDQRVS